MAVWICLNFTKPSAPMKSSVRVSITNIRLAMNFSSSTFTVERDEPGSTVRLSPADVQQHTAIDSMAISRFLSEERRCVVLGLQRDESVVTSQSPPPCVPAHAAADVACEERLGVVNAERLLLEETQAADATCDVWHHGRLVRRRDDEVAAVVHEVRRLEIRRAVDELEVLRDAKCAAHLALDADESIEVDGDGAAEVVVTEARTVGVFALGKERRAARNDGDDDRPRPRCRLLRIRLTRTEHARCGNQDCYYSCHDFFSFAWVANHP